MNVGDKAPELLGINEKGEEVRLKPVAFGIITQSYVKPDMK